MAAHLDRADAEFEFLVQVRDPSRKKAMPVEDASVEWSEDRAPFRKVARIVIPRQTFDTPERMGICEHLSFNPWRSLLDHRPIGGINRARRPVYEAVSQRRHDLNQAPRTAPVP